MEKSSLLARKQGNMRRRLAPPKRIDAISRVIYDPTGKQTGEYYPADATHFLGSPIRCKKGMSKALKTQGQKTGHCVETA